MRRNGRRLRVRMLWLAGVVLASYPLVARLTAWQGPPPQAPARAMINLPTEPALRGFRWRSIGPAGQGARIDDFAVDEKNPSTYYIGFAVSGLWKTVNNGTTFEPLMDEMNAHSIGDIALAPSNPNILYVGTGEPNNRQSSSFGTGVYKSTDAGATFTLGRLDRDPVDRARHRPSQEPGHRLGRGRRPSVRCERRTRRVHDDRRRQDVDEDALHQPGRRRDRPHDRPGESQSPVRVDL